ncbi:hypothetical protein KY342_06840 [Candidatus Woesearchaeota archaeon]|nr:hypothetical protein [Candidatus Woesearchaeota archaeon]
MKKIIFIILLILVAACSYKEETIEVSKLEIPFYRQSSSGNCMQTQVKMALKYYYPEKDFSFEELDKLSGRTPGKWTWTSQLLPVLIDNNLDAYYYSTTPYNEIKQRGEEFILEYYGQRDGQVMIDHTNFESLYSSIDKLNNNKKFFQEKLDFSEIENEFKKGHIIILIIDKNVLFNRQGSYAGHGITITSINQTHISIHDSSGTQNLLTTKEQLIKAWNAPGTDNDAIIIKGKI